MPSRTELVAAAVSSYLGTAVSPSAVSIVTCPLGSIAIRVEGFDGCDFLIAAGDAVHEDNLCEVVFDAWPPQIGEPRFY